MAAKPPIFASLRKAHSRFKSDLGKTKEAHPRPMINLMIIISFFYITANHQQTFLRPLSLDPPAPVRSTSRLKPAGPEAGPGESCFCEIIISC